MSTIYSMHLLQHLQAPYPTEGDSRRLWLSILGAGVFAALFLIVFQPFGTREFSHPWKVWFLAGYGGVISLGLALCFWGIPRLVPNSWIEANWTVAWHILWTSLSFSLTVFACYLYKQWFFAAPITWAGFFRFFPLAISVAIFPISAWVMADYIRKLKHAQQTAGAVNERLHQNPNAPHQVLRIPDEQGRILLEIPTKDLLYLQSAENYVEVFFGREKIKKEVVRNSLKRLENSLTALGMVRCHRSYLINPDRVDHISGNAQAYQAHFDLPEWSVPIARSRAKAVFAKLGYDP